MATSIRFPIKFDSAYALLSTALLLFPSHSYVEIVGSRVTVAMGWAFRSTFDRARITRAAPLGKQIPLTRGVHGWAGRWLVNGSGDGILSIDLEPRQPAYVMAIPVNLRQLRVSVDDPTAVAAALST
jgi:hypothetical protein